MFGHMSMVTVDFLAAARATAGLLRDPAVAKAWDKPSALARFQVAGLAGHLANQVLMLPDVLTGPAPSADVLPVVEHYRHILWIMGADLDAEPSVRVRQGGERIAEPGPSALADRVDEAIDALPGLFGDLGRPVQMAWMPAAMTVSDLLLTRLMELAVHGDDLAVSVHIPTPELPPTATEAVVDLLSRVAILRHGPLAVLRGLSRAERAPASITAF